MKKSTLIFGILIAFTLSGCIGWYDKISQLSDDELTWINCYNVGDTLMFYSDGNAPDTLVVDYKNIHNTTNRFYIHFIDNIRDDNFDATAIYTFYIKTPKDSIEGSFRMTKIADLDSIQWDTFLDRRFSNNWKKNMVKLNIFVRDKNGNPFKIESFILDGKKFDNCLIIDDSNSKLSKYNKRENPIECFVINKDYGLIYYRYADGKEYSLNFN